MKDKVIQMAQKRDYATKKKGKTKGYPFWDMKDIKGMIDYFKDNQLWNDYLKFMLLFLFGRRVGDTLDMVWSDIFYPNGVIKDEIRTIEEQKTGKYNIIYISPYAKQVIREYLDITKINPLDDLNDYIFPYYLKYEWKEMENDEFFNETKSANYNDNEALEMINDFVNKYNKDYSRERMETILRGWRKHQKEFPTLGKYIYKEIIFKDISKWQIGAFDKIFKKAVAYNNISYKVTIHSIRRSFGYYSKVIHPHDMLCLETLQSIFGHSDTQTTMHYIGLSEERERMYYTDIGDFLDGVSNGNYDLKKNTPVVTLKEQDLRNIILKAIKMNSEDDAVSLNEILNEVDELKVE